MTTKTDDTKTTTEEKIAAKQEELKKLINPEEGCRRAYRRGDQEPHGRA